MNQGTQLLTEIANGIPRGSGHTTIAVAAARASGATLVVEKDAVKHELRKHGVKVATMREIANRKVRGPLVVDPACIQALSRLAGVTPDGAFAGEQTGDPTLSQGKP